jgi:hypothetical protein
MEITMKVDVFGLGNGATLHEQSLNNKVKAMLSHLHITGDPQKDINDAIKSQNNNKTKGPLTKIEFVDP